MQAALNSLQLWKRIVDTAGGTAHTRTELRWPVIGIWVFSKALEEPEWQAERRR
jgi:hypothetical protein